MSANLNSTDRMLAALAYVPWSLGIILIFLTGKGNDPFLRYHAAQAVVGGLALAVISSVLGVLTFGLGTLLIFIYCWWAWKAYQGELFTIPFVTQFVQSQGWA